MMNYCAFVYFFFFKQKTAYEMRISDWSSDVCSSDLLHLSQRLLEQQDGPMLEALKQLQGSLLRLPARERDYPDRDRLGLRFERFRAASSRPYNGARWTTSALHS